MLHLGQIWGPFRQWPLATRIAVSVVSPGTLSATGLVAGLPITVGLPAAGGAGSRQATLDLIH